METLATSPNFGRMVRGIGDARREATGAAIASAVVHATGVRMRRTPIRMEGRVA